MSAGNMLFPADVVLGLEEADPLQGGH